MSETARSNRPVTTVRPAPAAPLPDHTKVFLAPAIEGCDEEGDVEDHESA